MSPPDWNKILMRTLNKSSHENSNNSTNTDFKKLLINAKHEYSKKKHKEGIQIISTPSATKHQKSKHRKHKHRKHKHKKSKHRKSKHKKSNRQK